jgi:hypothetical protein
MSQHETTGVTPEFATMADAVIAAGHHGEDLVLVRLNNRIDETPAGPERDNLLDFRRQLVEAINAKR